MSPRTSDRKERYLVVNADDFGLSEGVNAGIIAAYERGIVTSTSLMTRWPSAAAAAEYARAHPDFGVGLHLDLGEWACTDGEWSARYHVVPTDDARLIREEVRGQLEAFRRLVGRDPDHVDSHQHVHRDEPARSAAAEVAAELGVPLRHFTDVAQYCGSFYGQDEVGGTAPELVNAEALVGLIRELPTGVTELCCHPAAVADVDTMYIAERLVELRSLCDPRVRDAVRAGGVRLGTFASLVSRVG